MADVTHELVAQVADRVEHASLDDLALQFGEPDLDLVQPGRVSRSKMKRDVGMRAKEGVHQLGFMGRKVIDNEVDGLGGGLSGHHLGKKVNKLGAGVAGGGFANDLAAAGLQRRIERKSAVAVVFKAVALCASGRKRQDGIEPVEGLDGTFFVHTKHRRMGGWLEIKSDDIGRFGLEARIIAGHVTAQGVRLQTSRAPRARYGRVAGAEASGEPARAPVGGAVAGRVAHGVENTRLSLRAFGVRLASAVARRQSGESGAKEALLPGVDRTVGARELASDPFTVNSSLSAVPVYQAFGFAPAGSLQSVHGISFLPMRRPGVE
jgi:hypothetical protein